jgi:uncharacterized protein YjbI with pentapeptide repeats
VIVRSLEQVQRMANPKHLQLLKEALLSGNRTKWNAWRSAKYESYGDGYRSLVRVDISGADLRHFHGFSLLDLTGANLRRAQLDYSVLSSSHLMGADLRNTSLAGADLRRATLDGADLRKADLQSACLVNASR